MSDQTLICLTKLVVSVFEHQSCSISISSTAWTISKFVIRISQTLSNLLSEILANCQNKRKIQFVFLHFFVFHSRAAIRTCRIDNYQVYIYEKRVESADEQQLSGKSLQYPLRLHSISQQLPKYSPIQSFSRLIKYNIDDSSMFQLG